MASTKSTGLDAAYRCRMGLLVVVMERGRFAGTYWKDDVNALRQHLAQLDRSAVTEAGLEQKLRALEGQDASHPGVDFVPLPATPPPLPGLGAPLYGIPEWCSTPELRAAYAQMMEEE